MRNKIGPLGLIIFFALAQPASSCLCALACLPTGSCSVSEDLFRSSERVFLGEIIDHEVRELGLAAIRVRVTEWFKGAEDEMVVELTTNSDQVSCGVEMSIGLAVFYVPTIGRVRLCTTFPVDLDVVDPRAELRGLSTAWFKRHAQSQ